MSVITEAKKAKSPDSIPDWAYKKAAERQWKICEIDDTLKVMKEAVNQTMKAGGGPVFMCVSDKGDIIFAGSNVASHLNLGNSVEDLADWLQDGIKKRLAAGMWSKINEESVK